MTYGPQILFIDLDKNNVYFSQTKTFAALPEHDAEELKKALVAANVPYCMFPLTQDSLKFVNRSREVDKFVIVFDSVADSKIMLLCSVTSLTLNLDNEHQVYDIAGSAFSAFFVNTLKSFLWFFRTNEEGKFCFDRELMSKVQRDPGLRKVCIFIHQPQTTKEHQTPKRH